MKNIDIYNWKRKKHYDFYKSFENPCFSVNVNIDITLLIEKIKEKNLKFFPTCLFFIVKGMNSVDEFKYRIDHDRVIYYDLIHPSYTVLNGNENFVFCYTEFIDNFESFYNQVLVSIEGAKSGDNLEDEEGVFDLIFVSSIPWFSFNSVTHPFSSQENTSIPRVTFGKYFKQDEKILMPISFQVHHGLVDGLHIARLLESIDQSIKDF